MSLIPFILDLADELHEFSRCLANGIDINDFGFGLYTGSEQQQQPQQQQQQQQQQSSPRRTRTSSFSSFWMPSKRHHPYNRIKTACCAKSGDEAVTTTPEKSEASASVGGTPGKSASYSVVNKNGFQVSMNVKQFAPNELSVKTIDNCIVVEGRHDDKEDGHGVISRHFVRKYMLPKGYDPNDVLSTLSSDGILTVKAPPPPPPAAKNHEPNERIIEIQPTPGPTPVVVVSAKDTQAKETAKKLTTPSARLECQLPEKRQKLDLPPEPESTEAPLPTPPTTTEPASAEEANDVEMEKADEQINETALKQQEQKKPQQQQQQPDVDGKENNLENKTVIIEKAENEIQEKSEKIAAETEKILEETISQSNGDTKNSCEKMEESCSVTAVTKEKDTVVIPAEVITEVVDASAENKNNITKMDVDDDEAEAEGDIKDDENETKKAVTDVKTIAAAAAAAKIDSDSEKTNNTDTSISNTTTTTTTTTNNADTITTNNNNNNNNTTSTNDTTTTTEETRENSTNDDNGGNGVVTGKIPADIPKSDDSDAAETNASDAATAEAKAESAADEKVDETAVLTTEIDDVALLKAAVATAGPTEIAANEENVILTESMDGITTAESESPSVDKVECSLFNKKHLGNGNNTTTLVATEEMAN